MARDFTAAECPLLMLSSAGVGGLSTDLIHTEAAASVSAMLLHTHTLGSSDYFYTPPPPIFLKVNNYNSYKHKRELWPFKMFAIKCSAFLV